MSDDDEEQREVESRLAEVMALMAARRNRKDTDAALERARERRARYEGNTQGTYHVSAGGHVATTMHTKTALDLAEQLKLRIQLGQYAAELEDTLRGLSDRYVRVLERQLMRSRY